MRTYGCSNLIRGDGLSLVCPRSRSERLKGIASLLDAFRSEKLATQISHPVAHVSGRAGSARPCAGGEGSPFTQAIEGFTGA